jgi:hypothetical protein
LITIFTIPKPYEGHISIIQRNALQSWLALGPDCEVLLCGDDAGVTETAAEFGIRHIGGLTCNALGTPLLSSAFEIAQTTARHRLICYVNADIVFLPDFMNAVSRISFEHFLMAGQRWDLDVNEPINFKSRLEKLRLLINKKVYGTLHRPVGSDYFVFPKNAFGQLPDFAVGRAGWDNWLMYHAHSLGFPLIDASDSITAIHQNHDYAHVAGRRGDTYRGPESDQNLTMMSDSSKSFDLTNFTWLLTPRGLVRKPESGRPARRQLNDQTPE